MPQAQTAVANGKNERRRYPRSPVNRPARIRVADGPTTPVQLMNISLYGASLFYSKPLEPDTPFKLKFYLHTNPETVTLELKGYVRQSHLKGESHMIRVIFSDPPIEALKAIAEFTRQKLEGGK